jgi:hypothetical protein
MVKPLTSALSHIGWGEGEAFVRWLGIGETAEWPTAFGRSTVRDGAAWRGGQLFAKKTKMCMIAAKNKHRRIPAVRAKRIGRMQLDRE